MRHTLDPLFHAISWVESKHKDVVGAEGEIGRYQITYAYWLASGMPGKHEACMNKDYSRLVMLRYWKRFCRKALQNEDYEMLAKHHRKLDIKSIACQLYWKKVKKALDLTRIDATLY